MVVAALGMRFVLVESQTADGTDSTSEHRPPESRSGALSLAETARTFDSRFRTHHKLWSDWVLRNKPSVTGTERSNRLWWQDNVILEQFSALSVPKACPSRRR